MLLGDKITELGLVLLLLAWTVVCLSLGQHRWAQTDASQRAWLVLLPMVVGGIAAFVSPALLLSRLVSGQPVSGLEVVVTAALPVLLAIGTILCGFRAARVVENRGTVSRQFVRQVGTCTVVLTCASVSHAVWGFVPLAALALTVGGPLAVFALIRGMPRRAAIARLSTMVAAVYSMLVILAIAGAVMTYGAAAAITAFARRVADRADAAGFIATPGAILLGLAAGYVIWQVARERILDPASRPKGAPPRAASADHTGLAIAKG